VQLFPVSDDDPDSDELVCLVRRYDDEPGWDQGPDRLPQALLMLLIRPTSATLVLAREVLRVWLDPARSLTDFLVYADARDRVDLGRA
jgi:hypothetical protein